MIDLTYDPRMGLPARDGEISDLVADIVTRHDRGVTGDKKYVLKMTTSSWLVVLALLQYVLDEELAHDMLQITCVNQDGSKYGPKPVGESAEVSVILNGDEYELSSDDGDDSFDLLTRLTGIGG